MHLKTQKFLAVLVIAVLILAAMMFWRNGGELPSAAEPGIETAKIERGDIERTVATSGAVRPLITVEVGSQLSGQIAEIFVDFNSRVEKDQLIALIDPQTFESRVLQSKADLEVSNATVVVQRANIDRATANLRKARLEFERAEPLVEQGTLSVSEYDTALANFESAKADLTVAEAQLENARANRAQRQAALESAQIDLDRTRIRSPIDGVVIRRAVDKGQTVAASLSSPVLFNIAQDLAEIQIEANVDEADIGNVSEGNDARFAVDAYPDLEFSGVVAQVRLSPIELNNVVTYTVIITAANPDLKLLPGMTAIVEIVTGKSEDVLRVANNAIRFRPAEGSPLASMTPAASNGGGRGGGRRMMDIARISQTLGLDASQTSEIENELQEVFSAMRGRAHGGGSAGPQSAQGEGDQTAMRQRISDQVNSVFQRTLSKEQFRRYRQIRRQRTETRNGQLWIQDDDGEIRPVSVRLGISDDSYTQLISRDLAVGDVAITRMRESRR